MFGQVYEDLRAITKIQERRADDVALCHTLWSLDFVMCCNICQREKQDAAKQFSTPSNQTRCIGLSRYRKRIRLGHSHIPSVSLFLVLCLRIRAANLTNLVSLRCGGRLLKNNIPIHCRLFDASALKMSQNTFKPASRLSMRTTREGQHQTRRRKPVRRRRKDGTPWEKSVALSNSHEKSCNTIIQNQVPTLSGVQYHIHTCTNVAVNIRHKITKTHNFNAHSITSVATAHPKKLLDSKSTYSYGAKANKSSPHNRST